MASFQGDEQRGIYFKTREVRKQIPEPPAPKTDSGVDHIMQVLHARVQKSSDAKLQRRTVVQAEVKGQRSLSIIDTPCPTDKLQTLSSSHVSTLAKKKRKQTPKVPLQSKTTWQEKYKERLRRAARKNASKEPTSSQEPHLNTVVGERFILEDMM